MHIAYRKGDLFKNISTNLNIYVILHICNNLGKWGRGFVIPLGKKYPKAESEYLNKSHELGDIQIVQCKKDYIINMIAQNGIRGHYNPQPLIYMALEKCLENVNNWIDNLDNSIIEKLIVCGPKFGSGLAGGDWNIIESIIKDKLVTNKLGQIYIYEK